MLTDRRAWVGEQTAVSVVALVPARSGSKAIKDKNVSVLAGHPLLGWAITAARRARSVDRVLLSTDSPAYAEVGKRYGAEVPFLRPDSLATDDADDRGFVVHALDWMAERGEEPDILVLMRPTTPLRTPDVIDRAVECLRDARGTAVRSLHEMSETAYKTFEVVEGFIRPVGSLTGSVDDANGPRQGFPVTYEANGYVDVLSTKFIRSAGLLYGDRVIPFMTEPVVEVDTADDLEYLEYQVGRNPWIADLLFQEGI